MINVAVKWADCENIQRGFIIFNNKNKSYTMDVFMSTYVGIIADSLAVVTSAKFVMHLGGKCLSEQQIINHTLIGCDRCDVKGMIYGKNSLH